MSLFKLRYVRFYLAPRHDSENMAAHAVYDICIVDVEGYLAWPRFDAFRICKLPLKRLMSWAESVMEGWAELCSSNSMTLALLCGTWCGNSEYVISVQFNINRKFQSLVTAIGSESCKWCHMPMPWIRVPPFPSWAFKSMNQVGINYTFSYA